MLVVVDNVLEQRVCSIVPSIDPLKIVNHKVDKVN